MGKKKGGDDARKAQEAKQKAEAAARQAAEQKERQRQQEQERQRNAGRQSAPQQQQQQQPSVKAGLQQVGNKLSKGEAKDLKQGGYSLKQISKIAGKVEAVKPGAQKKLEKWHGKAQKAKELAGAHHGSGSSGGSAAGNAAIRDLMAGGGGGSGTKDEGPGISAGGSYGTADRNGWLAAELNAVDTFRPNTTPTLFNNYRPTDLSGQLNDAVAEANRFIDSAGKSSSSSTAPSVSPSALAPRSLLEEDEQERYGLAF